MRVTLVLIAGAMALPALAGSSPPEITLSDPPEQVLEVTRRTAEIGDPVPGVADEPAAKEHDNQVDDPDFPPCGDGG